MSGQDDNHAIEDSSSELSDYEEAAPSEGIKDVTPQAPYNRPSRVWSAFWTLPQELRLRILRMACGPETLHHYHPQGTSNDCTKTMTRLALACKDFHCQVIPMLYANVRLSHPSTLAVFHRTLTARPALGRLVRRLHIGPDDALPGNWWPLVNYPSLNDSRALVANIVDSYSDPRLSKSFCRNHHFPLQRPPVDYGIYPSVMEALGAGAQDLDVDVNKRNCAHSGPNIGSDAWHVRVLELQAAMELWCLDFRRWEQEVERRTGDRPHSSTVWPSPRLTIGTRVMSSSDGRDVLRLTRAQLYDRMTRRGAPTDDFSHPLLFARSGLRWRARDLDGEWHEGGSTRRDPQDGEDLADAFAWDGDLYDDGAVPPPSFFEPLEATIPPTATLGGNLALARSVLSLTPFVSSLSLTGFLERALAGNRPPPHQDLFWVSLGPPPSEWSPTLRLDHSSFRSVERLRVCCAPFGEEELGAIAGEGGALANLYQLDWTVTTKFWQDTEMVNETIQLLLESDRTAMTTSKEQKQPRKRPRRRLQVERIPAPTYFDFVTQDEDIPSGSLDITLNLHPDTAAAVLRAAGSDEIAAAWRKGERVPGQQHRLRVLELSGDEDDDVPLTEDQARKQMYEEGRRWWEREWRAEYREPSLEP